MQTITQENLAKLNKKLESKLLLDVLTQEGLELYPGYAFEKIKDETDRQYILGLAVGYDEIEQAYNNYAFGLGEDTLDTIKHDCSKLFTEYAQREMLFTIFQSIISVIDSEHDID